MRWTGERAVAAIRQGGQAGVLGAANLVAQAAQANAPRDSGALARSMRVSADGLSATICFDAPHAAPVHEGTKNMAGRPYLGQAMLNCADAALAAMAGEITL